MQDVPARGGRIILITDRRAREATVGLGQPRCRKCSVTPLVYASVQLIAHHTAVVMGTDVDQPRNRVKSVTVE